MSEEQTFDKWYADSEPPKEIKEELRRQNSLARTVVRQECESADLISICVDVDTVMTFLDKGAMLELKEISVPIRGKTRKVLIIAATYPPKT